MTPMQTFIEIYFEEKNFCSRLSMIWNAGVSIGYGISIIYILYDTNYESKVSDFFVFEG